MKNLLLLVGLILLAVTPPGHSAAKKTEEPGAKNCVPDEGCPKGLGPPKCCDPPKCAFWEEYLAAKAKADVVDHLTGEEFELTPLGFRLTDVIQFRERVGEQIRLWQKKAPRCRKSERLGEPPIFSVMPGDECRIMTRVGPGEFAELNLYQLLYKSDTCEEIVNARYSAARARSQGGTCFLEQHFPKDYAARLEEFIQETQREAKELDRDLERYWSVCSNVFSAKTAKKVADYGVGALRGETPMPPAPKAKRSRKPGLRR